MTDTNQLPPLPQPEGIIVVGTQALRGFTADQMHAYALQAIAHATQAEVTDEQIIQIGNAWAKERGFMEFETNDFVSCAHTILALRPAAVPMTDEQWLEYLLKHANNTTLSVAASVGQSLQTRGRWVLLQPANNLRKLVERAYGITAQAKKETP